MRALPAPSEVVGPPPTLDELANTVRREHAQLVNAGAAMIEHAIRAGDALCLAKEQVERGGWDRWLKDEFPDKHPKTLRLYMRVARYQDRVRAAQPATLTAAHRLLAGEAFRPHTDELREEARRLSREEGLSIVEISARLGASKHAIGGWLNPAQAERRRQRMRQESREARRALHRQQRDRAARKAGGSVGEAYALVRKALQSLEDAHRKEADRETKRHIERAMRRAGSGEDEIVKACRLAVELKEHISLAMQRVYASEDEIVKASRGAAASSQNRSSDDERASAAASAPEDAQ